MARVLVAPLQPRGDDRLAHCQACWQEVYLSRQDLQHVWYVDRGLPVLCANCKAILDEKGTLA